MRYMLSIQVSEYGVFTSDDQRFERGNGIIACVQPVRPNLNCDRASYVLGLKFWISIIDTF